MQQPRSLADRFGEMMRHAGCAITVTSITDFIAFVIGTRGFSRLETSYRYSSTAYIILRDYDSFRTIAFYHVVCFHFFQVQLGLKRKGSFLCFRQISRKYLSLFAKQFSPKKRTFSEIKTFGDKLILIKLIPLMKLRNNFFL
jgi:hypothetical protein